MAGGLGSAWSKSDMDLLTFGGDIKPGQLSECVRMIARITMIPSKCGPLEDRHRYGMHPECCAIKRFSEVQRTSRYREVDVRDSSDHCEFN